MNSLQKFSRRASHVRSFVEHQLLPEPCSSVSSPQNWLRTCVQKTFTAEYSSQPSSEDVDERELGNPKVHSLVEQVLELNMLEFADFTKLVGKRLGVPDQPMMPMGMMPAGAMPAAPAEEASKAEEAVEEKTSFSVKLEGFDSASKIKVIKEIRAITQLGLKEAKELVEGAPCVIKPSVAKEEAEEMKKKIEEAGGKVALE